MKTYLHMRVTSLVAATLMGLSGVCVGNVAFAATPKASAQLQTSKCDSIGGWTATSKANVRRGPGLDYAITGTVRNGGCVVATNWFYDSRGVLWIYKTSGTPGWVSTRNLR